MKNRSIRDDFIKGRLYPFLLAKAELEIAQLYVINSRVYYIKTKDQKEYILKSHRQRNRVVQQAQFFDQMRSSEVIVPFIAFPNGQQLISDREIIWTLTPYVKGRRLQYSRSDDRKKAVQTLTQFHRDATNIFLDKSVLREASLLNRWYDRLLAFERMTYFFDKYGYSLLCQDMIDTMKTYLELAEKIPWERLELEASQLGTWIHRDVASHNFIMPDDSQTAALIDFDLLTIGSQLEDEIQLGQRFLPYLQWDLAQLLTYEIVPASKLKYWLIGVLIPSDVMREWLYKITRAHHTSIQHHLKQIADDWEKRRQFLKNAEIMLKSL